MPRTSVRNDTEGMLCLWLEPWGSDHWMRPGERFTVVASNTAEVVDEAFEAVVHDQGISVWVNAANHAEVFDADGNEACCGHQRPVEAIRQWTESARLAVERVADKSPKVQELTRRHYELLLRSLAAAEAAARETQTDGADGVINVPSSTNNASSIKNP
jgi:hypothetical protein